jgi:hypothetical protein
MSGECLKNRFLKGNHTHISTFHAVFADNSAPRWCAPHVNNGVPPSLARQGHRCLIPCSHGGCLLKFVLKHSFNTKHVDDLELANHGYAAPFSKFSHVAHNVGPRKCSSSSWSPRRQLEIPRARAHGYGRVFHSWGCVEAVFLFCSHSGRCEAQMWLPFLKLCIHLQLSWLCRRLQLLGEAQSQDASGLARSLLTRLATSSLAAVLPDPSARCQCA